MLLKHGFPEETVLFSDVFFAGLDGVSVVLGLSGDHEPMDLLGESSVVGEDVLVGVSLVLVGSRYVPSAAELPTPRTVSAHPLRL